MGNEISRLEGALLQATGISSIFAGLFLFIGALSIGQPLWAMVFLTIALGGAYAAYYPYKHMENIVARPPGFKDIYYDEKGLYYNVDGKPYLLRWNEVEEYKILSITEVDQNVRSVGTTIAPTTKIPFDLARYIAWRKIDPEYATTGIMKLGTVQFVKKDGSSIVLTHVINPYRLIPIFDRYIKEESKKKSYHF